MCSQFGSLVFLKCILLLVPESRSQELHNSIVSTNLNEEIRNLKISIDPLVSKSLEFINSKNYDYFVDAFNTNRHNFFKSQNFNSSKLKVTSEFKKKKEYAIFSTEFHRVETPFIIGIWIFSASVAKIGKRMLLLNNNLRKQDIISKYVLAHSLFQKYCKYTCIQV